MFVDEAKKRILEMMQQFEEVDVAKTPTFFFLDRLRAEMKALGLDRWVEPALGSIELEISGLGMDYEPHAEWLSAMAKSYAKNIKKVVETFQTFGDEVLRSQLSNLALKME